MSVKQGIAVGSLPVKCLSGQSDLQLINQAKTFTPMRADTHQSQKRITKDTHVSSIFVAPVVPIVSPIFPFAFAHGSSLECLSDAQSYFLGFTVPEKCTQFSF